MNLIELFQLKSNFVTRNIGEELVIVPLKDSVAEMNEMYTLNGVGSSIWAHIDGVKSFDEIVASIVDEYNIDEETAKKDVLNFIEKLQSIIEK